jgi:hypothetical protein
MREWVEIIQDEFREMPALRLTKPQVRRLWGLDAPTCEAVLDSLRASHVLTLSPSGRYSLDHVPETRQRPARQHAA